MVCNRRPCQPTRCHNEFQNARPPRAQTLPLIGGTYGMSRWQLSDKTTTIAGVHVRGVCGARSQGATPDLLLQRVRPLLAHCSPARVAWRVRNQKKRRLRLSSPTRDTHIWCKHTHPVPTRGATSGHPTPGIWGIRMGLRMGIPYPQLYPPACVQIPTQIQGISNRSPARINPDSPSGPPSAPIVPHQCRIHFPTVKDGYIAANRALDEKLERLQRKGCIGTTHPPRGPCGREHPAVLRNGQGPLAGMLRFRQEPAVSGRSH
jgi:hypothetical protein